MGFLHEHKISRENDFHALLQGGKTVTSYPLRFLYSLEHSEQTSFQVAISVPKKRFHHAVDRNLLKRRIREGIRHSYNKIDTQGFSTKILIVYCDNNIQNQQSLEHIISKTFQKIFYNAKNH